MIALACARRKRVRVIGLVGLGGTNPIFPNQVKILDSTSGDKIMRTQRILAIGLTLLACLILSALAGAQTWTFLNNQPANNVGSPLLLTDGTVIVQEIHTDGNGTGVWYKLTPDNTGSYINGTWSQIASMPAGYAPEFYASAVLPDGRAIVEGGEYNGTSTTQVETYLGAIYDPAGNTWTAVNPPSGWSEIGDGQSVVLADGTFMLGNCCYTAQALFEESTLTWNTQVPSGKKDANSEEGWTLLPNGDVLTVDISSAPSFELFNVNALAWTSPGSTPESLVALCEIGPQVLRPDGTVIVFGANGNNAIYNSNTGEWSDGPPFPSGSGMAVADGPAALLPDGNVLVQASGQPTGTCLAEHYAVGSNFYEFNGSSLTNVGTFDTYSFSGRMLVLPTGQVLWTNSYAPYSPNVQIYIPSGTYESAWQPTISSVASTLNVGSANNVITGTQFNGLSQGAMFGDDAQMATNYPLVRITNSSTGHVFYAKTHSHSTMGVATGSATVSTEFDVPSVIEVGASTLEVVANGIPSAPVSVTVTYTLLAGTSPSIAGTNNGKWESAFQAYTGTLWIYGPDSTEDDIGFPMMAGTSPSITGLSGGGWELTYQGSNGDLYVFNYLGSVTNAELGMKAGTSPSIAGTTNGGWEAAFQANTGSLWVYNNDGGATNAELGMMAGTSPSITGLSGGGWEVAFQANTGSLWVYNSDGGATNAELGMMAGTSPSIAATNNGKWESAFQANTGTLWIYGPDSTEDDIGFPMKAGTSPSIAGLSSGGWELAYQASNGNLYVFNYLGSVTNTGLSMKAGTSPSIAGLSGGGWEVVFQASTGDLWSYNSSGGATLLVKMKDLGKGN
jgi:hypothetical protein